MKQSNNLASEVIDQIIEAYNGVPNLQKRFNYSEPMGVYNWRSRGIPRALLADIFLDTGIPIERLKAATKDNLEAV